VLAHFIYGDWYHAFAAIFDHSLSLCMYFASAYRIQDVILGVNPNR